MNLKDYSPLIGVLVGGVLAIIGGLVSNLFVEWRRNVVESKRLAYAFKGELQALSSIARKRRYTEIINYYIAEMEKTRQPLFVNIQVRREYFNVFNSNVSKLGLLKNPLPELLATFYVQSNSILEDLQSYREGTWANASVESIIGSKKELLSLMEDTYALAEVIVKQIDKLYS